MNSAREAWLEAMAAYKVGPGMVQMPEGVSLSRDHVARARLVASREELLEFMPRGGVVAEVGVADGNFSQRILDIVKPRTLHPS